MQTVCALHTETVDHAFTYHEFRAAAAFFGGLKQKADRSGELAASGGDQFSCAEQHGDVPIVAACVHRAVDARAVVACIFLENRQGIHVGAQHHAASRTRAAHHADDTGYGDSFVYLETERAQAFGDDTGGAVLLKAELGMHVEVPAERGDVFGEFLR